MSVQDVLPAQATTKPLSGHVYLIDDNDDVRGSLSTVLRHYGLTVESFADVDSFINGSLEVSPAVLVSDMVLPGKSGLDLLKMIRAAGWLSPIVFISGHSQPDQIIDAMKMGAVDFLWKPFSIDKLVDSIAHALKLDNERLLMRPRLLQLENLYALLTEREREVCLLAVQGYGNIEISKMIDVQPDTVKKHRSKVMEKMQTSSLAQLIEVCSALPLPLSS